MEIIHTDKERPLLDFSLSVLPFIAVAFVNFLASWLWFSPAAPWFKAWARGTGFDPDKKEMTEEEKKEFPLIMAGALVSTLLLSYGLQVIVHSVAVTGFIGGAAVGTVAWAAFAVSLGLNSRFEGRKPAVIVINLGLYLLTYALSGGVFAVWR